MENLLAICSITTVWLWTLLVSFDVHRHSYDPWSILFSPVITRVPLSSMVKWCDVEISSKVWLRLTTTLPSFSHCVTAGVILAARSWQGRVTFWPSSPRKLAGARSSPAPPLTNTAFGREAGSQLETKNSPQLRSWQWNHFQGLTG